MRHMNDNKDINYNLNIAHSYKEWDTHDVSFINKHTDGKQS